MDRISQGARGRYAVRTASAEYLLDLDAATVTRAPPTSAERPTPPAPTRLRRDGEQLVLVAVLECKVASPMQLLVEVDPPNVLTYRRTTAVCSIERLR